MQVETVKQRCYHLKYQSEICGGTILVREIYENELKDLLELYLHKFL